MYIYFTVTKASHGVKTTNIKAITQYNNVTETYGDYSLGPNVGNTPQSNIAVDNKVYSEMTDSSNNGMQHNRYMADKQCETNIWTQYSRIIRKPYWHDSHKEMPRNVLEII